MQIMDKKYGRRKGRYELQHKKANQAVKRKTRADKRAFKENLVKQASLGIGRGCTVQIFASRNIIEQCMELQRQLNINFIEFENAFDRLIAYIETTTGVHC